MDWKKAIGFGAVIWVAAFIVASIFIAFKIGDTLIAQLVTAVIAGAASYVLAGKIKPANANAALSYGAVWVIVGVILDAIITMRFAPQIFYMWTLWLSYILVLLAPLAQVKKGEGGASVPPPTAPAV